LSNCANPFLNICTNIVQSLLPQDCLLCGAAAGEGKLCSACLTHLPYLAAPGCPVCAIPTTSGEVCGHCLKKPPAYDATVAAFSYVFPLDALVQSLKYGGNLAAVSVLAQPLLERVAAGPRPDLLIPMPLFPTRLRERGFNQSLELARPLARAFDIPLAADAAERIRDTAPQASLPLKERRSNIKGAFGCNADLSGKSVAIVDDVMTSGTTLDELARTLRRRGAARVSAWVVARALMQK
jgi:ComF family protein